MLHLGSIASNLEGWSVGQEGASGFGSGQTSDDLAYNNDLGSGC